MALDGLLTSFGPGRLGLSSSGVLPSSGAETLRSILVWVLAGGLLYISAAQNYDLVFNEYYTLFRQGAWNSSDMGKVVREFEQTYGTTDTVWIVPFPHWVDTRLPAVWAGIPNRDMAMWRENLPSTLQLPAPKMFLVKANLEDPNGNDQESLDVLEAMYPNGQLRLFDSDIPGHDFWIFTVPK
jgi:hypothetical protein